MEFVVLAIIVAACGYRSFQIGVREGAERCVKKLHEEKIISIKTNGDIIPNPFYIENKTDN